LGIEHGSRLGARFGPEYFRQGAVLLDPAKSCERRERASLASVNTSTQECHHRMARDTRLKLAQKACRPVQIVRPLSMHRQGKQGVGTSPADSLPEQGDGEIMAPYDLVGLPRQLGDHRLLAGEFRQGARPAQCLAHPVGTAMRTGGIRQRPGMARVTAGHRRKGVKRYAHPPLPPKRTGFLEFGQVVEVCTHGGADRFEHKKGERKRQPALAHWRPVRATGGLVPLEPWSAGWHSEATGGLAPLVPWSAG
jgi:hypothetical protein